MQSMTGKNPSETVPGTALIFFNTDMGHDRFKLPTIDMLVNSNDQLWCDWTGRLKEFGRLKKAEILKDVEKVNHLAKHRC